MINIRLHQAKHAALFELVLFFPLMKKSVNVILTTC